MWLFSFKCVAHLQNSRSQGTLLLSVPAGVGGKQGHWAFPQDPVRHFEIRAASEPLSSPDHLINLSESVPLTLPPQVALIHSMRWENKPLRDPN